MPYVPGGSDRQVDGLRRLLRKIDEAAGSLNDEVEDSNGKRTTLRKLTQQIAPAGVLVRRDRDRVEVSPEIRNWLDSGDDFYLVATFHRHVRFIGELLAYLAGADRSTREITDFANQTYDLGWKTLDQVRRRVYWLSEIGLLEKKTSQAIGLTERGQQISSYLEIYVPGGRPQVSLAEASPVRLPEIPPKILQALECLDASALKRRASSLGYIPRGNSNLDAVESLTLVVNACLPPQPRATLMAFARDSFGTSDSSFGAVQTTLTSAGLIGEVGPHIFGATESASEWLESGEPINLLHILHTKFLFVYEILAVLQDFDRAPELARVGFERFGMARVDIGGIRTRLQFLRAAGLIEERSNWRYQPTALGFEVAQNFALQADGGMSDEVRGETASSEALNVSDPYARAKHLADELLAAGLASETPLRLEEAVAASFDMLGFDTTHLGGPGKTDVLLSTRDQEGRASVIVVDAKSAKSGIVGEGAVHFDTLTEHQKKHAADHLMLVGPSFEAGRVRERATGHSVALITTARLGELLLQHAEFPRSAWRYLPLFDGSLPDQRPFELARSRYVARVRLIGRIVEVLAREALDQDEVTKGALSLDQIYLIVRGILDPRPTSSDIEDVLRLLTHGLLESVVEVKAMSGRPVTYRLVDQPRIVRHKLAMLSQSMDAIDLSEPG